MWSGPRNVSTAVMYAFAQRSDTKVVDEPFYAHYLLQSGADHPGRSKVLQNQPKDPGVVMQNLLSHASSKDRLFLKNMAHHMINMDRLLDKLFTEFHHVFLIRDPKEMLPSLHQTLPNPTMQDTAYQDQHKLFSEVKSRGLPFQVIDSAELLKNPRKVLSDLCSGLGIPFEESMLSWSAGPIPEDGVWAEYWYDGVHKSTGFKPYSPKEGPFPEKLNWLYNECKPIYEYMFAHAIKS